MGIEVRARVRFGVLGPLEALRDDEPIRLGGERQRALLALLLVNANQPVSTNRLIGELLQTDPSGAAVNAVHAAVSRLRRALASDDDGPLVTRPGGYQLTLDSDQLDAARFEALVRAGRRLQSEGDASEAAERLRQALGLWRGPPLADLAGLEVLQPEIRRLQELRLLAIMDRIDADLACGRHAELTAELEALVAAEPLRERLRGQLMLSLYRSGRRADALAAYRQASRLLRDELGLEPARELQQLEGQILRQDAALGAPPPTPRATSPSRHARDAVVCPFKGLAAFDIADAEFFCGRDVVVSDVMARLAESPLVGIVGSSGVGKSSLLRAGVLTALRDGALPRSAGWPQILLRPGEHPLAELERATGGGLLPLVATLAPGDRIVLAIDQLEELFTLGASAPERAGFMDALAGAAADPHRRVLVVCALRADFYGRFGSHAAFAALISHSHVLIGPMDRRELTQAIEQPAARAGLEIERPLVDTLVAEVADEPGALPLLSTTLQELWRARDGRTLRFSAYRETGGVRGAVARLAENAYEQLSEPQRRAARNLLLRLVGGEEGGLARRRVPQAELEHIDDARSVLTILTDARLLTVSDGNVELSHEALLREWPRYRRWLAEDETGRRLHAHLIAAAREWDRRGRDAGELYRAARLASALDWAAGNRDWLNAIEQAFLRESHQAAHRDRQRQRAQRLRLRALRIAAVVLLVLASLAGGFALVKQQSADDAARAAAADSRAALGRQLGAEAVSEPSLELAMLLAREAVNLNRSEQTESTLLTTLLRNPAVIGSFPLPGNLPGQLAVSPNGRTLAVAQPAAGRVRLYNTVTHRPEGQALSDLHGGQGPVFSPDGSLLAYPDELGGEPVLAVRDARTLEVRAGLGFDRGYRAATAGEVPGGGAVIAPDDRSAYFAYWRTGAGEASGAAYVDHWLLPGGRLLAATRIGVGPVLALRLVDGGRRLMIAYADRLTWWNAATLAPIASRPIAPTPVGPAVASISPDGRTVTIGTQSGGVWFVDAASGHVQRGTATHGARVAGVFYAGDGHRVSTVGNDDSVIVWDPARATALQTLSGPTGQVRGAAASPDGSTLYTSSLDGEVLVSDLTGDRRFRREHTVGPQQPCCVALSPEAPPLAVSPDGSRFAVRLGMSSVGIFSTRTFARLARFSVSPRDQGITTLAWSPVDPVLAVAGRSGFVQMWATGSTPHLLRSLLGLHSQVGRPEAIQALTFSPDGSLLAASDENEARTAANIPALPAAFLAVWRLSTGTLLGPPRELHVGPGTVGFDSLSFSPSGDLLAASVPNGRVLVMGTASGQIHQTLAPAGAATAVAFSAQGTVAVGTQAGTVDLFDPLSGAREGPALIAASTPISSLAFDHSGQRFVTTAAGEGAVRLWFTRSLQAEGPPLAIGGGDTTSAAFAPHGDGLLVVGERGTAYQWPTSPAAWAHRACAIAGRNLTHAEWSRLVTETPYRPVCGN